MAKENEGAPVKSKQIPPSLILVALLSIDVPAVYPDRNDHRDFVRYFVRVAPAVTKWGAANGNIAAAATARVGAGGGQAHVEAAERPAAASRSRSAGGRLRSCPTTP